MTLADAAARHSATDPLRSFCVTAPAGSGKTELLIQRFLALLARVERPEQVLAITFTRKAAAEMRERVLQALREAADGQPCEDAHRRRTRELAVAALAADAQHGWRLLRDISRLNIKTIDSFCLSLTRQMPVLSGIGGQVEPRDDALPLYREAVIETFRLLETRHEIARDLRALLAHFDNDWGRVQGLLGNLLARRSQWQAFMGVHRIPRESEAYLVEAVQRLVSEVLGELHDALELHRGELLALLQYSTGNRGLEVPERFPAPESSALPVWRQLRDLLLTSQQAWRKTVNVRNGFPAEKNAEAAERKARILALLEVLSQEEALRERLARLDTLPQIEPGEESWRLVLHLSRILPVLAAQLLLVFRRHGVVDYPQIAESALQALGEDDSPTELALRLDYRFEHILVDEFQDTSVHQFELLHRLTRGWGEHNAGNPVAPRTLFIVGDAMQSIYGFRDANVGLFLRARQEGFNDVPLEHLELRSNFRSRAEVVDWVNAAFGPAFPAQDDIGGAQVAYSPAVAVRPRGEGDAITLDAFCGDSAREAEIEFVCDRIAACVDAGEEDIAVLGRQRNHLRPIARGLKERGVRYHAQDLESLASSTVVTDLLSLCRALGSDADTLSWFALLRAPWCGLKLEDLLAFAHRMRESDLTVRTCLDTAPDHDSLSEDGRFRLFRLARILQQAHATRDRRGLRAWIEQTWLALGGPECAPDTLALEDAESFLRLLEQAEREGRGLCPDWLQRQLQERFTSGGDPSCPVQLLTLHKAKGLEFSRVFIPQLNRTPPAGQTEILLWDEHVHGYGERSFLLAADDRDRGTPSTLYNYLREVHKRKTRLEKTRLLYVGATRAIRHLHLSAQLNWPEDADEPSPPARTSLLSDIWTAFEAGMTVHRAELQEPPAVHRAPPLLRLASTGLTQVPDAPPRPPTDGDRADRAHNHFERAVGTVVHVALEDLSRLDRLPARVDEALRGRCRLDLQREGLWGDALERGVSAVAAALERTLAPGGRGPWLLDSGHPEARSEWALTAVIGDQIRDIVIDRSFVDADSGVRWIVDYKTSEPRSGESAEAFALREAAAYREQLHTYREVLRVLDARALRCALYFTAIGRLHVLEELDLAAGER